MIHPAPLVRPAILQSAADPTPADLPARADRFREKGDPIRALTLAQCACRRDDRSAAAWRARADAQYALGNLAEAQACLAEARRRDPTIARDYTEEGARANGRGRVAPDNRADTQADFQAGRRAYLEGRPDAAIEAFTRVLERKPGTHGAWSNRGLAHAARRDFARAIDDFDTALVLLYAFDTPPDLRADTLVHRAGSLLGAGRAADARADCERALALRPGHVRAKATLAAIDARP